ncbi:MAG: 2,3-dihydroxybiphenyl 1,2-dioxygenase [Salinisphaeraceae bacterium]|nr:2,3-dihydroxybiphenyl 1,2-dioxygenase [Salinisphaeraceae bacterium]
MAAVTELGYLGLNATDLDAWKVYATQCVGLEVLNEGEGDRFYLRMDHWHHRLVVHESAEDDLAYMGWRVADAAAFDAMARQLDDAGLEFQVASDAEAAERRVLGMLHLQSPGDIRNEVFFGAHVLTRQPFHPGRPLFGRFVTGDQGLGHCILREDDVPAAAAFYGALGLNGGVEYRLPMPDGNVAELYFMHCNDRQHSIAYGAGPQAKRINHLMLEYTELDDLGLAHDIIRGRGIDVALQLGKHSNDQALTFYSATPSGWLMELGWGARKALAQQEYYGGDIFGHKPETGGYGLDIEL